jgi:hypothetical protein
VTTGDGRSQTTGGRSRDVTGLDYDRLQRQHGKLKTAYEVGSGVKALGYADCKMQQTRLERYRSAPVHETLIRLISGKPCTLHYYRARAEKQQLLTEAIRCADGDAILTVWIRRHIFKCQL